MGYRYTENREFWPSNDKLYKVRKTNSMVRKNSNKKTHFLRSCMSPTRNNTSKNRTTRSSKTIKKNCECVHKTLLSFSSLIGLHWSVLTIDDCSSSQPARTSMTEQCKSIVTDSHGCRFPIHNWCFCAIFSFLHIHLSSAL